MFELSIMIKLIVIRSVWNNKGNNQKNEKNSFPKVTFVYGVGSIDYHL